MARPIALLLAALLVAGGAASAQSDDIAPEHVRISLTSFRITPATINLERGRRYILDIANDSGSSHDFSAREFFGSVEMAPAYRATVERGELELKGHQSAAIMLVPGKSGDFEVHCGHLFHAMFGMRGVIHVN
ncbi:MAG TPA: cupredoxin domain-containing protein [Sphingomicrobium sp.]|nr:cupredoxin domain-containing protein [Sphingomicrobium sp.]